MKMSENSLQMTIEFYTAILKYQVMMVEKDLVEHVFLKISSLRYEMEKSGMKILHIKFYYRKK